MSDLGQNPTPELQFQHAEPLPEHELDGNVPRCVVCKTPIGNTYFHAQGQVVCPACAEKIRVGQQSPPPSALGRAVLYGAGAALAGCILYAAVAIIFGLQIGIVAILVGIMVGKAIRIGSRGLGGRPQQVIAVLLTYFAITTSYIPVAIYHLAKNPKLVHSQQNTATGAPGSTTSPAVPQTRKPQMGIVSGLFLLMLLFAAAPFLGLKSGIGGILSLFIIFIGLQRAWHLTGRTEILVMGPYETTPAQ